MLSSLRTQGPIATGASLAKIASSIAPYRGHNAVWVPDRRSLALTCPGRRGGEFSDSIVIQREDVRPHSRGAMRPSFASIAALDKKRAQGKPGARCTRGLVCKHAQKNAHEHTGSAEASRPSLRNGLRLTPRSPR